MDFMDRLCNCNKASKVDGQCIYGSKCRKSIVVYNCECLQCGANYVGNTQNHLKKRIGTHLTETRKLLLKGEASDSFARHFGTCYKEKLKKQQKNITTIPTANEKEQTSLSSNAYPLTELKKLLKVSILWQGKAISTMKTFGKLNCQLCMQERLRILQGLETDRKAKTNYLINASSELYGACRHKPKFHRYQICLPISTDEGSLENPEKSNSKTVTRSPMSLGSPETELHPFRGDPNPSGNNGLPLIDTDRESNGYRVMDV